jgi:hypothetical protein
MQNTRDSGRNIGALVLIGLGVAFLLGQLFNVNLWSVFGRVFDFSWPFWIILPGALFLLVAFLGDARKAPLAFPGMVITGTGVILLVQEMTGRYETWAYVWGLYPVLVGLALMFVGNRTGNPNQVDAGRKTITIGLILTAVFGVFMESIFNGSFDRIFDIGFTYFIPLVLICVGLFLLLRHSAPKALKEKTDGYTPSPNGKPKREPQPTLYNGSLQKQVDEALTEDDQ